MKQFAPAKLAIQSDRGETQKSQSVAAQDRREPSTYPLARRDARKLLVASLAFALVFLIQVREDHSRVRLLASRAVPVIVLVAIEHQALRAHGRLVGHDGPRRKRVAAEASLPCLRELSVEPVGDVPVYHWRACVIASASALPAAYMAVLEQ